MPIYNYECMRCGEELERFEHVPRRRPQCKCGKFMKKIPSVAFAQFFGAGAFATEYGSQWRNKWGSAFYKQNVGKEPRDQVSGQPHDPTSWEREAKG